MQTKPTLGFTDAQTLAGGCLESASRLGVSVSIAIVDEAGKLIHFIRMDEARAYTADLAIRKAQPSACRPACWRLWPRNGRCWTSSRCAEGFPFFMMEDPQGQVAYQVPNRRSTTPLQRLVLLR